MNQPTISVVMSVYNTGKYLCQSIESILNQTFTDFEFIIIDDKSTDDSLQIIKEYQTKDKRIKVIENSLNNHIRAINIGLEAAKGKYIARMDADDVAFPNKLDIQYTYLEQNLNVFLVGSEMSWIDESGKPLNHFEAEIMNRNDIVKRLEKGTPFGQPTIMFRNTKKYWYREKAKFCEDYDFYLQLIYAGEIMEKLQQPLLYCRINLNSESSNNFFYQRLFFKKMRDIHQKKRNTGVDDYETFSIKEILDLPLPNNIKYQGQKRYHSYLLQGNRMSQLRKSCSRIFKEIGYSNIFLLHYFASFLPYQLIVFIIKNFKNRL